MALAAYRNLLRAAHVAFQGDQRVLSAARQRIRDEFRANRSLASTDAARAAAEIQRANDAAKILTHNVVQGEPTGDDLYRLRIHEKTERGDNDSVKDPQPLGRGRTRRTKCCSE